MGKKTNQNKSVIITESFLNIIVISIIVAICLVSLFAAHTKIKDVLFIMAILIICFVILKFIFSVFFNKTKEPKI
jgi:uncharacterized membrane protein